MNDEVLKISISTEEEDKLPAPKLNGKAPEQIFNTRAHEALKELFGDDYWTLRDSRGNGLIELKVSIKKDRVEEFRAKIAQLGFTEVKQTPEQLSDQDAGRA